MLENSILTGKPTVYSDTLGEDIIHLLAQNYTIPEGIRYRVIKVSKDHIARPDLISKFIYGETKFGDLLCKLNGISNPFELNEGDILIVPSVGNIMDFFTIDSFDDSTNEKDKTGPKPKNKNEKRKPNEAIVGDTRFKIDKDKRVIIY